MLAKARCRTSILPVSAIRGDSRKCRSCRSCLDGRGHVPKHLPPALRVLGPLRELEEDVGVGPRDGRIAHQRTALGGRERREELLYQFPVRLVVEILLDDLPGTEDREIDGFTPQIRDRAESLVVDLLARPLEHLLLLGMRLLEQLLAHSVARSARFANEALGIGMRAFEQLPLLIRDASSFSAIPFWPARSPPRVTSRVPPLLP